MKDHLGESDKQNVLLKKVVFRSEMYCSNQQPSQSAQVFCFQKEKERRLIDSNDALTKRVLSLLEY